MLVLSRRLMEAIRFPGIDAIVRVVAIKPGVVSLGIEAPPAVTVLREELAAARQLTSRQPRPSEGAATDAALDHFLRAASRRLGLALLRLQADRPREAEAIVHELHRTFVRLRRRQRDTRKAGPLAPVKPRKDCAARNGPAVAHD
jgi:carbon storage regulator CsrA